MLYTRFAPLGPQRWAVLSRSNQVAEVAKGRDGMTVTPTKNNALSREEVASVAAFIIRERERRVA